ncbi:MAG: hypothetical protein Q8S73_30590 [Deltaproteobacteria bacterium]|nr:hypothetical protein [Deltaproteobacteria bacterium]
MIDIRGPHWTDTLAIEIKTWWTGDKRSPLKAGLGQFDGYLSEFETDWPVIFDQRKGQPPLAKRTRVEKATTLGGRTVAVVWG